MSHAIPVTFRPNKLLVLAQQNNAGGAIQSGIQYNVTILSPSVSPGLASPATSGILVPIDVLGIRQSPLVLPEQMYLTSFTVYFAGLNTANSGDLITVTFMNKAASTAATLTTFYSATSLITSFTGTVVFPAGSLITIVLSTRNTGMSAAAAKQSGIMVTAILRS